MKFPMAKLGIQALAILLMGILGATYSMIFSNIATEVAINTAPTFHYRLLERFICPETSSETQNNGKLASMNANAFSKESPSCIKNDGNLPPNLQVKATQSINITYFLLCFVPTFIPGTFLMWKLINHLAGMYSQEENPG